MPPALEATAVTYRYGQTPALRGVDLRVEPGESVALLGPNGAGKTTLVGTATGLLRPASGRVRVAGGDPRDARTRLAMGVVLQQVTFPRTLTVRELVTGAAVRAGVPASRAATAMAEAGLTGLADRRATKLSGGQVQRLQLARALVTDPALLILDEPTVGLDPDARRRFWADLAARRDAGMAILLTTHLVEEAGAFADRVVVIVDGRIVADADPATIADGLPDRTVTATTTVTADAVGHLPGVVRAVHDGTRLTVTTRTPEDLLRTLLARDPHLADLRVEGASLEEAVLALGRTAATDPDPDLSTATPQDALR